MRVPQPPPNLEKVVQTLASDPTEGLQRMLRLTGLQIGPAPDGKYRHWDTVRHLEPPDGLSAEEYWLTIKLARRSLYRQLPTKDKRGRLFQYGTTEEVFRMLHQVDRDAAGAIKGSEQITNPDTRETYLLKSLFEEAITSSQLEGAATTREVARQMLRERRSPRDRSEQMIYNNYQAMQFIRQLGDEPLTIATILELQQILTRDTLDDLGAAGRLRKSDEIIHVVDPYSGEILHVPPDASELEERLTLICDLANDTDGETFIHPVIRSILLHFQIGYDHPFVDGNGRTARALFYWSMRRSGYWVTEFVSISSILNQAPAQYARSYLYTETDDNDATYFIIYQLRVLRRAIDRLHTYLARKERELRQTREELLRSEILKAALNHRQLAVVNHALRNPLFTYTIASHRGSHNVSYETGRSDLLALVELGLLEKGKIGRAFVFTAPLDLHKQIQKKAGALSPGRFDRKPRVRDERR